MKLYTHVVTVRPVGNTVFNFPVDMLRYDELVPSGEEDSAKIIRSFEKPYKIKESFSIVLSRKAEKFWVPTEERWVSFLWKVVEHRRY